MSPRKADYVKAGGLGLSRPPFREHCARINDARSLIPGYRHVLDRRIRCLCRLPGVRGMPGCEIGAWRRRTASSSMWSSAPNSTTGGSPYGNSAASTGAQRRSLRAAELGRAEMAAGTTISAEADRLLPQRLALVTGARVSRLVRHEFPSVLTIHQSAYQGSSRPSACSGSASPRAPSNGRRRILRQASFLKAGIQ